MYDMLHIIVHSWHIGRMLIYVFGCFRLLFTIFFLNLWCCLAYFCLTSTTLTLFPHLSYYFINKCSYICTTQKSILRYKRNQKMLLEIQMHNKIYKGQTKQKYMDRSEFTDHVCRIKFSAEHKKLLGLLWSPSSD